MAVQGARINTEGTIGVAPLTELEPAEWSDASLGCPEEGMFYAQVITPGYRLVFDVDGTPVEVHTNSDGSSAVVCDQ